MLNIASLRVETGESLFLRGPSGSGKSTLLSLIGAVVTPDGGRIRVLGQELGSLAGAARDRFRADHLGVIFQLFNLLPYLSVLENVVLPCHFSGRRRRRTIENTGSPETEGRRLLEHLGLGDPLILSRPVSELSVGQQQRVAAARALIGAPEILIADEPTSALDTDARDAFIALLCAEAARVGSSLLFVSHDAALARDFDRQLDLAQINRVTRAG
ncbi:ABC transporter ATP-binding protein [Marinobacterium nitratireducens]|uniref:ABC transporter ATP-binding protein n=1 Tax=Marinobacterium nitratireducens TaxID=518897 RepID=UPI001E52F75F|nr:ABC transporter ATP-binding protein [Marinobacterium nitratireducens]